MQPTIPTTEKICPRCAETIKLEARVCRFCGQEFTEADIQATKQKIQEQTDEQRRRVQQHTEEISHPPLLGNLGITQMEVVKESLPIWGWLVAIFGGLLMLLVVGWAFYIILNATQLTTHVVIGLFISVPFLATGVWLFILGIRWIINNEKKDSRIMWGWISTIFGGFLTLAGTCLEISILTSKTTPDTSPNIAHNFGYWIGTNLVNCCIFPPFIILGVVLLIIGIRRIRKWAKINKKVVSDERY